MGRLGRYELIERLAIGGMGEVFLARQVGAAGFSRSVVVKRLIPELAERTELVTLFIDEARIAAHLVHPNIVQIYEFGEEDGVFFLAMEHVPGQNVMRILERAEREQVDVPRDLAVHVVAEVAAGLDFAHRAVDDEGRALGIVHRDVSPHNVMISRGGDVKLMDFGIAKAAIRQQRTETGIVRGKIAYMSPEQIEGREVDPRTDVYAAGILLWELTLRRRLFAAASELETLQRVRDAKVPRPREIDPSYPEDLEDIVLSALAREPADRTASAAALAASLREHLASRSARIEKAELGAIVRRLFPDRPSSSSGSSAPSSGTDAVTNVMAGTAPLAAEAEGASADQQSAPSTAASPIAAVAPAPAPSRRALPVLVLGAATIAAVLGIWGLFAGGPTPRARSQHATAGPGPAPSVSAPPAPAPAPSNANANANAAPERSPPPAVPRPASPDPAPTPPPSAAASPSPAIVASQGPSTGGPDRRSRRRPTDTRSATTPTTTTASPTPTPSPSPTPAVAMGTLRVDWDPWASVRIDGKSADKTPFSGSLAPGRYEIEIDVSRGGGTRRATAVVSSGKTTKCRPSAGRFACGDPR